MYLWRSPHARIYLVDHTGTHPLGNTATAHALWDHAGVTSTVDVDVDGNTHLHNA